MQSIHIHLHGDADQARAFLEAVKAFGLDDLLSQAGGGSLCVSLRETVESRRPPRPRRQPTAAKTRRTPGRKR